MLSKETDNNLLIVMDVGSKIISKSYIPTAIPHPGRCNFYRFESNFYIAKPGFIWAFI